MFSASMKDWIQPYEENQYYYNLKQEDPEDEFQDHEENMQDK